MSLSNELGLFRTFRETRFVDAEKYQKLMLESVNWVQIMRSGLGLDTPLITTAPAHQADSRKVRKNHVLIFSEGHARRILNEYVTFFNHSRPHQGINQHIPDPPSVGPLPTAHRHQVIGSPILHGLHHDYRWAA
jgi:transposase InsO family protein